jgi:hypothetical protein
MTLTTRNYASRSVSSDYWPEVCNDTVEDVTINRKNELMNQHAEGKVAKTIEQQTAKLPSDVFLWSSLASMGVSLVLGCMRKKHMALFIGQWAAPFLLLGVYNKIVKTEGHDQTDH